jgi:hypothetical protein
MAIDGFYSVDFSAVTKGAKGIVIVESGKVRGGDDQYLYSGTVTGPDERLHVKLAVKAYVPGAVTVFNTTSGKFELELTGNVIGQDLQFSGAAPIPGAPGITIRAHRLASVSLS